MKWRRGDIVGRMRLLGQKPPLPAQAAPHRWRKRKRKRDILNSYVSLTRIIPYPFSSNENGLPLSLNEKLPENGLPPKTTGQTPKDFSQPPINSFSQQDFRGSTVNDSSQALRLSTLWTNCIHFNIIGDIDSGDIIISIDSTKQTRLLCMHT